MARRPKNSQQDGPPVVMGRPKHPSRVHHAKPVHIAPKGGGWTSGGDASESNVGAHSAAVDHHQQIRPASPAPTGTLSSLSRDHSETRDNPNLMEDINGHLPMNEYIAMPTMPVWDHWSHVPPAPQLWPDYHSTNVHFPPQHFRMINVSFFMPASQNFMELEVRVDWRFEKTVVDEGLARIAGYHPGVPPPMDNTGLNPTGMTVPAMTTDIILGLGSGQRSGLFRLTNLPVVHLADFNVGLIIGADMIGTLEAKLGYFASLAQSSSMESSLLWGTSTLHVVDASGSSYGLTPGQY